MRDGVNGSFFNITTKGTVAILFTGGTIQGAGKAGEDTGYISGCLSSGDILPGIKTDNAICAIDVCNINSDDVNYSIWKELVGIIEYFDKNDNVVGIVIAHGTDTMEETAVFLDLTIKTQKSVIITGAMFPSTSIHPDGPRNLEYAIELAGSGTYDGKGVIVTMNGECYSALSVYKKCNYRVDGFEGSMQLPRKRPYFDINDIEVLPKVPVIYFSAETDADLLEFATSKYDGIVIAGAGSGEYSKELLEKISALSKDKMIVISSRISDARISKDMLLDKDTIPGMSLNPQKAAVLLRLCLSHKLNKDRICTLYNDYSTVNK